MIHPNCYHIGGSHIKESMPVIEANTVTGKEMILGMLQYIWPKVGFKICIPSIYICYVL